MNDLLWLLLRGWSVERWDRSNFGPDEVCVWIRSPAQNLIHIEF